MVHDGPNNWLDSCIITNYFCNFGQNIALTLILNIFNKKAVLLFNMLLISLHVKVSSLISIDYLLTHTYVIFTIFNAVYVTDNDYLAKYLMIAISTFLLFHVCHNSIILNIHIFIDNTY